MICREGKFVFVHIYKTAGTSIQAGLSAKYSSLSKTGFWVLAHKFLRNSFLTKHVRRHHLQKHAGVSEYKIFLGDNWNDYFKFSFVRNPYDWQVSIYEYIRSSPGHSLNYFCNKVSFREYLLSEVVESMRTQSSFLMSGQSLLVDYVGHFETLEDDWNCLSDILSIPLGVSLPKLNKSKRLDIRHYYDSLSLEIVRSRFKDDFVNFGYPQELQCSD